MRRKYSNLERSCFAFKRKLQEVANTDSRGPYSTNEWEWSPKREGFRLYMWCRDVLPKLDLTVRSFYISKSDIPGLARKGQYLMRRKEADAVIEAGGRIREIHCHCQETRKAFRELLKLKTDENGKLVFGKYHALGNGTDMQTGFIPYKDIFDSILSHETAKYFSKGKALKIDLQDAFQQITQGQIERFVRIVFDLNRKHARQFAEACCYQGRLFQGNPIAPALFNALTTNLCESLNRILKDGYATQYADDILIVTKRHMSKRFREFIRKLIHQNGLMVNEDKLKTSKLHKANLLGTTYRHQTGEPPRIVSKHQRRRKKQVRYLKYLKSKGIKYTKRISRDGKPIEITAVIEGLEGWIDRVEQASQQLEMEICMKDFCFT